jgi:hypothetical protein
MAEEPGVGHCRLGLALSKRSTAKALGFLQYLLGRPTM